jgi:hypothetical protein
MAKQGQHKRDARDPRISRGRNKPRESVLITAGTPKKRETYEEQARQHKDTDPEPQRSEPRWSEDTREQPREDLRIDAPASRRSGSDSNASRRTRGH